MIVNVTQEHINIGQTYDCAHCPIAYAIKDATHCQNVRVGPILSLIGHEYVQMPRSVAAFIDRFDRHGGRRAVRPFSFEMNYTPKRNK